MSQTKIPSDVSIFLRYIHQEDGAACSELVRRNPQYAPRSIYRHAKKSVGETIHDKRRIKEDRVN